MCSDICIFTMQMEKKIHAWTLYELELWWRITIQAQAVRDCIHILQCLNFLSMSPGFVVVVVDIPGNTMIFYSWSSAYSRRLKNNKLQQFCKFSPKLVDLFANHKKNK